MKGNKLIMLKIGLVLDIVSIFIWVYLALYKDVVWFRLICYAIVLYNLYGCYSYAKFLDQEDEEGVDK